jgi:hypothetical protein
VELRICRKEKRKRDLSGRKKEAELKIGRNEGKKGDLSLLKGKMNGTIILKERNLEWSPELGRRKRVMEFLVSNLRVTVIAF